MAKSNFEKWLEENIPEGTWIRPDPKRLEKLMKDSEKDPGQAAKSFFKYIESEFKKKYDN